MQKYRTISLILDEFDEPRLKRPRWDEPSEMIKLILEKRNRMHKEHNVENTLEATTEQIL